MAARRVPVAMGDPEGVLEKSGRQNANLGAVRLIIGPPGSGKTTWIVAAAVKAIQQYGAGQVLVVSLTKAAATELRMRMRRSGVQVKRSRVSTLHALCYHSLGRPRLTEDEIDDWNDTHPAWPITGERFTEGKVYLDVYNALRASLVPDDEMLVEASSRLATVSAANFSRFVDEWDSWKRENELLDFEDLVQIVRRRGGPAPGQPRLIYVDEATDHSKNDFELIREWASYAHGTVLVGDPDQVIYEFRGASPEDFLSMQTESQYRRVLDQSYRLPRAVHARANEWIREMPGEHFDYRPRDEAGVVRRIDSGNLADEVARDIDRQLGSGRNIMLIGTCAPVLSPFAGKLREMGVPFYNPYALNRGDWNPLAPRKNATTAAQRVASFLEPAASDRHGWSGLALKTWLDACSAKVLGLAKGAKKQLREVGDDEFISPEAIADWFNDKDTPWWLLNIARGENLRLLQVSDEQTAARAGVDKLDERHFALNPWIDTLVKAHHDRLVYPARVAELRGVAALSTTPKVVFGTIHSVKGAEADVVYVLTALSAGGQREYNDTRWRGRVYRQFYVAMTRAREELVVCANVRGSWSVPL